MYQFLEKLIDPGGNIASVIGLLITLVGFWVTIQNTRKSKTAAEQAKIAVQKIREDMRQIDIVSDLSMAVSILDEIRRLHRQNAWEIMPDRYAELKRILISIHGGNPELPDDERSAIQNTINHISAINKQVESSLSSKKPPPNITRLNGIISGEVDKLQRVLTRIKSNIGT